MIVYGRKTYQLMVPYWPDVANDPSETKAKIDFAKAFVAIDKVVFSRSLDSIEGDARVVRTDLREALLKLKQEAGKNILVGGVDLPSQLIELGLVDEHLIVIQPVIVGEGRRLLGGIKLQEELQLELVESQFFKSGALALRYAKK